MKKTLVYLLAIIPLALLSCLNEDDGPEPFVPLTHQEEVDLIEDYLEGNNITFESDTSGLRYVIDSVGSGQFPVANDTVSVRYTGFFIGGNVFDTNVNSQLPLRFVIGKNQVIKGFEYGVMKLREGGSGTFYLPSRLGYGAQGVNPTIPPYSLLGFEVELVSIN